MAWIYNKQTKVLTECHNKDVIAICKKDVEGYAVNVDKAKLVKLIEIEKEPASTADKKLEDYTVPELKKMAEEQGIEGCNSLTKTELLKVLGG